MNYYEIETPLTETEKEKLLAEAKEGEASVHVTVGQEPSLTEMFETIIWLAKNLNPAIVEFEIDPTFTGEEEYKSAFSYLTSAGYEVHNPKPHVVNVPVFKEEDILVIKGDTILNVPDEEYVTSHPGSTIQLPELVAGNELKAYRQSSPLWHSAVVGVVSTLVTLLVLGRL